MSPTTAYILGLLTPMIAMAVLGVIGIALVLLEKLRKWAEPLTMYTAWGDRRFARKMRLLVLPDRAYESKQLLEYLRSDQPWTYISHLIRFYRIMHRVQPRMMIQVLEDNAALYTEDTGGQMPTYDPFPDQPVYLGPRAKDELKN